MNKYHSLATDLRNIRGDCEETCRKAADVIEKFGGQLYPSFSEVFEYEAQKENKYNLPAMVGGTVFVLKSTNNKVLPEAEEIKKIIHTVDEDGETFIVNGYIIGVEAFFRFDDALIASNHKNAEKMSKKRKGRKRSVQKTY